jgi:hypothetical protein
MPKRFLKPLAGAARAAKHEGGFAVPTVLMLTLATMSIVTVGVLASIQVEGGTVRDKGSKSALTIAEAGVEQALLHYNRIPPSTEPCAPVGGTASAGWCPPVAGGFNGGTYTYQLKPVTNFNGSDVISREIEVVSTGNVDGVQRRVDVVANSTVRPFREWESTVLAQDGIHLNSEAYVGSNMATNGDVLMDSNAQLCGHASYGVGQSMTLLENAEQICGTQAEKALTLPPVNQGDAPTVNDNGRFFSLDLVSGNRAGACFDGVRANGQAGTCGERHLDITGNSSVTLGGARYSFCKLSLNSNTALYVEAGKTVTIYFDSPEACGLADGESQLELASNARITTTPGAPVNIALLFVGSDTMETRIQLNSNTSAQGNCNQNFVIYAPRTDIQLNSNASFCGAIGGKNLEIRSESRVYLDSLALDYALPNAPPHYAVESFIDCSSASASPPDAGC